MNVENFFDSYNPTEEELRSSKLPIFEEKIPVYIQLDKIPKHFTKKEILDLEDYFTEYDLYVEKIKEDLAKTLDTKLGFMAKDKEIIEDFMNHWIDIHTNDFYKLWKKYRVLCGMITKKKQPQLITPEMIQRAKDFPIRDIIQFNSDGYRTCIFHSEKTPSMMLNKDNNTVKCFGCGKYTDAIGVCMQEYLLDFKGAVIKLTL